MKLDLNDIGGEVVKDNETYLLKDNRFLNNLVLSSTLLNPFKQTTGHNHSGPVSYTHLTLPTIYSV